MKYCCIFYIILVLTSITALPMEEKEADKKPKKKKRLSCFAKKSNLPTLQGSRQRAQSEPGISTKKRQSRGDKTLQRDIENLQDTIQYLKEKKICSEQSLIILEKQRTMVEEEIQEIKEDMFNNYMQKKKNGATSSSKESEEKKVKKKKKKDKQARNGCCSTQ